MIENTQDLHKWRFWPVLVLAFLYPINNALLGIAIPLYYFQIGQIIAFIGFISASSAITYSFSPLALNKFAEKLGRKRSIILAMSGVLATQCTYYISLLPYAFIGARMVEGLMMGLFWPTLQSSISDNTLHDHSKMMSWYNISWNGGIVMGYALGAIFLYIVDDVSLIFYIAPLFIIINLLVVIFLFEESKKINLEGSLSIRNSNQKNYNKRNDIVLTNYYIPLVVIILLMIVFTSVKGSILFLYPIKSEVLGFSSFTVYIQVCICVIFQLFGTSIATFFSIKNLKRIPLLSILILSIAVLLFGLTQIFFFFMLLFIIIGFACGLLYGFALKLTLIKNMQDNTSRYSGILESVIGSGFLITPIASGFIAFLDLELAFYIISVLLLLVFIPCFLYTKQVQVKETPL
ncbi:MAG: MFS transporter [Promethearchaeota archaeon]